MSDDTKSSITQLNSFLRSELSAVETYHDVLQQATGASARATLEDCSSAHASRAQRLRDAIERMGGTPAAGSGARGTLARVFGRSALALGGRTGVAALARSEDRALRDYRDRSRRLNARGKRLVNDLLLPSQEHTTRVIHDLSWTLS
jgi:hypothetical protein